MKKVTILLLSDSQYEIENIQNVLGADFGKVLTTTSEKEAIKFFKKNSIALLVLSYEHIDKAVGFYLSLYEGFFKKFDIHHKILLLCSNKDSEKSYKYCENGVIDDYITSRPLFDSFRLRLSVQQNIKAYEQEKDAINNARLLEKITTDMHNLNVLSIGKLQELGIEQTSSAQCFDQYSQELSKATNELQQNIKSLFSTSKNRELNSLVEKELLNFQEKSIDNSALTLSEQLHSTQNKIEDLVKDFKRLTNNSVETIDSPKVIKVVVIDDDDMYREMVDGMLDSETVSVKTFDCGLAAIDYLHTEIADIILLDYMMPELDGLGVLRLLKSSAKLRDIPVVMLTGDSTKHIVVESIKAGAKDYIVKPANRKKLLDKINSVVNVK